MAKDLLDFIPSALPVRAISHQTPNHLPEPVATTSFGFAELRGNQPRVSALSLAGLVSKTSSDDPFGFRSSWEKRTLRLSNDDLLWPRSSLSCSSSASVSSAKDPLALSTTSPRDPLPSSSQNGSSAPWQEPTMHSVSGASDTDSVLVSQNRSSVGLIRGPTSAATMATGPSAGMAAADAAAGAAAVISDRHQALLVDEAGSPRRVEEDQTKAQTSLLVDEQRLAAALRARQLRLQNSEEEAVQERQRASARIEALAAEVNHEKDRALMLRGLVARARRDACASSAARIVAEQKREEALNFRRQLLEERHVLQALEGSIALASAARGAAATLADGCSFIGGAEASRADTAAERSRAAQELSRLREELRSARAALELQQVRSDNITEQTRSLERELFETRRRMGVSIACSGNINGDGDVNCGPLFETVAIIS